MYPTYRDLREALGTPKWWDPHGVPRYCEFAPDIAGEIYCEWVSLMTVTCQSCGAEFLCSNAQAFMTTLIRDQSAQNTPEYMIPRIACWGDAPWHDSENTPKADGHQCAGTTMSTDFAGLRVWHRHLSKWTEVENPMRYLEVADQETPPADKGRTSSEKALSEPSKLEVELRELSHEDLISFALWCASTNRPAATSSLSVWRRQREDKGLVLLPNAPAQDALIEDAPRVDGEMMPRFTEGHTETESRVGDPVNPSHYRGDLVMRIIEHFALGFELGNVVKYILRHREKAGVEDLKKARWYLDRIIGTMEGESRGL